jgi:hypothetical protein
MASFGLGFDPRPSWDYAGPGGLSVPSVCRSSASSSLEFPREQAYVPAEQSPSCAYPRFPPSDADPCGSLYSLRSSPQGPRRALCLGLLCSRPIGGFDEVTISLVSFVEVGAGRHPHSSFMRARHQLLVMLALGSSSGDQSVQR